MCHLGRSNIWNLFFLSNSFLSFFFLSSLTNFFFFLLLKKQQYFSFSVKDAVIPNFGTVFYLHGSLAIFFFLTKLETCFSSAETSLALIILAFGNKIFFYRSRLTISAKNQIQIFVKTCRFDKRLVFGSRWLENAYNFTHFFFKDEYSDLKELESCFCRLELRRHVNCRVWESVSRFRLALLNYENCENSFVVSCHEFSRVGALALK